MLSKQLTMQEALEWATAEREVEVAQAQSQTAIYAVELARREQQEAQVKLQSAIALVKALATKHGLPTTEGSAVSLSEDGLLEATEPEKSVHSINRRLKKDANG